MEKNWKQILTMCENELSLLKNEMKPQRPKSLNISPTGQICSDDEEIDVVDGSDSEDDNAGNLIFIKKKYNFDFFSIYSS